MDVVVVERIGLIISFEKLMKAGIRGLPVKAGQGRRRPQDPSKSN
jgi:hypothetical protein